MWRLTTSLGGCVSGRHIPGLPSTAHSDPAALDGEPHSGEAGPMGGHLLVGADEHRS